MATTSIEGTQSIVRRSGWNAAFALKREISVALNHIEGARAGTVTSLAPYGVRAPGTYVPKVIAAGSYWWKGRGWSFWSVRHPENTVDIRLRHDRYTRLAIEVEDPHATAAMIDEAIRTHATGASSA